MQMTDLLAQTGGIKSIARELGVSESQAATGAEALIPAILGGFKKQAQAQPSGLAGLGGLLGQLGGGSLLDNVLSPETTDVSRGNDVLGQIFASKDVSRTVAQNAASRSGLSPSLLQKMLPMLAMLVAGYMAKQPGEAAAGRPDRRWPRRAAGWLARQSGGRPREPERRRAGRTRVDARLERGRQCARRHPPDGRQADTLTRHRTPTGHRSLPEYDWLNDLLQSGKSGTMFVSSA